MYDVVANFKSTCHGSYLWKGSRHESFSLNQVIFQSFQLYNRNRHSRELSILANENQSFELPKDKGHVFQNTHVCEWNSLYYSYVLQKYLWPHFSHYEYGGYNRVVITYNRQNAAHHLIVSLYKQTHTHNIFQPNPNQLFPPRPSFLYINEYLYQYPRHDQDLKLRKYPLRMESNMRFSCVSTTPPTWWVSASSKRSRGLAFVFRV